MKVFGFIIDFWTIWGLIAQFIFFLSFVVQWYKSERRKKSFLPKEFWYLRLLGSLMLFVYIIKRRDLVFFVAIVLQIMIYTRNIVLLKNEEKI